MTEQLTSHRHCGFLWTHPRHAALSSFDKKVYVCDGGESTGNDIVPIAYSLDLPIRWCWG